MQHVAVAVEDLPKLAEELKAAGVEFDTNVISSPGLRHIFTARDPGSGMMYELIERMIVPIPTGENGLEAGAVAAGPASGRCGGPGQPAEAATPRSSP